MLIEGILIHAKICAQEVCELHAAALCLLLVVILHIIRRIVHKLLRIFLNRRRRCDLSEQAVVDLARAGCCLGILQILADALFIGSHIRVLTVSDLIYEIIGKLRHPLYGIDRDGKDYILSCQLFCIIFREGQRKIDRIPDLDTYQSILEARNKCTGTDLQIRILCRTAFKCLAVQLSFIINICGISFLDGTFGHLLEDIAARICADLLEHLIVAYGRRLYLYRQTLVLAQLHIIQCLIIRTLCELQCLFGGCLGQRFGICFRRRLCGCLCNSLGLFCHHNSRRHHGRCCHDCRTQQRSH